MPRLLPTRTLGALLVALAIIALGSLTDDNAAAAGEKSTGPSKLTDLKGLDTIKTVFNRDAGIPRLVLILSPT